MMKKLICVLAAALTAASVCIAEGTISADDIVTFGHYEQDNDLTNGKEPIKWRVMEIVDGDAMLLSQSILDSKAYNDGHTKTSWSKSTLRAWLNSTFYDEAFDEDEKSKIVSKALETRYEPETTTDPVTLLSCPDALRIFHSKEDRRGYATPYALAQGVFVSKKYAPASHWWARNPSWEAYDKASYIAANGGVMKCGGPLETPNYGVRPVIYVNVNDLTADK